MLKQMDKKYSQSYAQIFCSSRPMITATNTVFALIYARPFIKIRGAGIYLGAMAFGNSHFLTKYLFLFTMSTVTVCLVVQQSL